MSQDPYEIAQREIERLWRDLVYHRHPGTHFAEQPWVPSLDVVVTEAQARVIVELAGVPREGVRVRLRGARPRSADDAGPRSGRGAHYHRAEIYWRFPSRIELPWVADAGARGVFRDGMLSRSTFARRSVATDVPVRGARSSPRSRRWRPIVRSRRGATRPRGPEPPDHRRRARLDRPFGQRDGGGARPSEPAPPWSGREVPILPIRHTVLFPFAILPLNVGRQKNVHLLSV
jgi:HSP20 family molecular chaperone IbpA